MKDNDIHVVGLSSSKPKGKTNWKVLGALIGIVVLAVGVIAGIILVKQNQNIEEKASCKAACPNSNGDLVNCYGTSDTNGDVSKCLWAGRVEVCGQNASSSKQYCCPTAGGTWTTNLSLCPASSPTATASATASATVSATSTSTATATAAATSTTRASATATTATSTTRATSTPRSTATAVPVPVTGVEWPTMLGIGFGIIMVLASLSLAI